MLTTTKTTATADTKRRADGNGRRNLRSSPRVIGPIPPSLARSRLKRAIRRRYGPAFATPRHKAGRALSTIDQALTRGSRHAPDPHVIDLDDTYRGLTRSWTPEELAARYDLARQHARRRAARPDTTRPIPQLARAIPPAATLSTTIHLLHALPKPVDRELPEQLLKLAQRNGADALHACHHALSVSTPPPAPTPPTNGSQPSTTSPARCSSPRRVGTDPPTVVQAAQDVSWLSRASPNSTKTPKRCRPAWPKRSRACSPSGPSPTPRYATNRPPSPASRPRSTSIASPHRTGRTRSIETTSTPRSLRSTPAARTARRRALTTTKTGAEHDPRTDATGGDRHRVHAPRA